MGICTTAMIIGYPYTLGARWRTLLSGCRMPSARCGRTSAGASCSRRGGCDVRRRARTARGRLDGSIARLARSWEASLPASRLQAGPEFRKGLLSVPVFGMAAEAASAVAAAAVAGTTGAGRDAGFVGLRLPPWLPAAPHRPAPWPVPRPAGSGHCRSWSAPLGKAHRRPRPAARVRDSEEHRPGCRSAALR